MTTKALTLTFDNPPSFHKTSQTYLCDCIGMLFNCNWWFIKVLGIGLNHVIQQCTFDFDSSHLMSHSFKKVGID